MNKNLIIDEIKRTSKANGGKPLGKTRFFQETGIKESDWCGKYWTKWGDAVIEAGYLPNKLNEAFPDVFLLEKYALLVRELGHVPTSLEVKMKGRNTVDFPSHNTFLRFGSKQQLLRKL